LECINLQAIARHEGEAVVKRLAARVKNFKTQNASKGKLAAMRSQKSRDGTRILSRMFAWTFLALLLLTWSPELQSQTVAMTVDDLPYASGSSKRPGPEDAKIAELINKNLLRAFSRHHIPVTGFVIGQNAEQIGLRTGQKNTQAVDEAAI
jgi:peptidoglycan/xylan/chitin deacetylase (PgdA/CDA1 family)